MSLDGLAPPGGEVVQAGDPGVEFMEALAHGISCPAQEEGRLSLAEVECPNRLGHEPSALGTVEGMGGLHQPRAHRRTQFHVATSCHWEVGIVQNSSGRFIFLNPPKKLSENALQALENPGNQRGCGRSRIVSKTRIGRTRQEKVPGASDDSWPLGTSTPLALDRGPLHECRPAGSTPAPNTNRPVSARYSKTGKREEVRL